MSATLGDWELSCNPDSHGGSRCDLHQILRDDKGRQIVAFEIKKSVQTTYLSVTTPLGLSIPFGVSVVLAPNISIPLRLATCDPAGCQAVAVIDKPASEKLKTATQLGVMFQDSKSGKIVTINGSPNGLAQGIAMVEASAP